MKPKADYEAIVEPVLRPKETPKNQEKINNSASKQPISKKDTLVE